MPIEQAKQHLLQGKKDQEEEYLSIAQLRAKRRRLKPPKPLEAIAWAAWSLRRKQHIRTRRWWGGIKMFLQWGWRGRRPSRNQGNNHIEETPTIEVKDVDEEEVQVIASPPKVQANNPTFTYLFKILHSSWLLQNPQRIIVIDSRWISLDHWWKPQWTIEIILSFRPSRDIWGAKVSYDRTFSPLKVTFSRAVHSTGFL